MSAVADPLKNFKRELAPQLQPRLGENTWGLRSPALYKAFSRAEWAPTLVKRPRLLSACETESVKESPIAPEKERRPDELADGVPNAGMWSLRQAEERCVTNNHFNYPAAACPAMHQLFDRCEESPESTWCDPAAT